MQFVKKIICRLIFLYLIYTGIGVVLLLVQGGGRCLPNYLQSALHIDYTLPFMQWIPRRVTSFCLATPGPRVIAHTRGVQFKQVEGGRSPLPIPPPGEGYLAIVQVVRWLPFYLPYGAYTTKSRWHFRVGLRWDDVDNYYIFPSYAAHKLSEEDVQNQLRFVGR